MFNVHTRPYIIQFDCFLVYSINKGLKLDKLDLWFLVLFIFVTLVNFLIIWCSKSSQGGKELIELWYIDHGIDSYHNTTTQHGVHHNKTNSIDRFYRPHVDINKRVSCQGWYINQYEPWSSSSSFPEIFSPWFEFTFHGQSIIILNALPLNVLTNVWNSNPVKKENHNITIVTTNLWWLFKILRFHV